MFYAKSTNGFYSKAIHGENIPRDAVEISDDEHRLLMNGQGEGKIIASDKNGYPVLSEPLPPSQEMLIQEKIMRLKIALAEIDDKRIRPLAEGDTERLEELNAVARELRAELQALTEELRELEAK